jgi:hypothetical protein
LRDRPEQRTRISEYSGLRIQLYSARNKAFCTLKDGIVRLQLVDLLDMCWPASHLRRRCYRASVQQKGPKLKTPNGEKETVNLGLRRSCGRFYSKRTEAMEEIPHSEPIKLFRHLDTCGVQVPQCGGMCLLDEHKGPDIAGSISDIPSEDF